MWKKPLTALVLGVAIISSNGCVSAPTTEHMQEPLPLPDAPLLPRVAAERLECLSNDAYTAMVERDVVQAEHIKRLERIILTTHGDLSDSP